MSRSSLCVILSVCLLASQVQASTSSEQPALTSNKASQLSNRRLLADDPVTTILKDVLCGSNQLDAIVEGFLGTLVKPVGVIPAILSEILKLDSQIESELEKALGINPPKSCSVAPKTATLTDILAIVYCSVSDIDTKLDKALGLEGKTDTLLGQVTDELIKATDAVEADLVKIVTGITCS